MAGVSLLRPQYNNHGMVATRLAGGARQVAHESGQGDLAGLADGRASGDPDDTVPQEVTAKPFEEPREREERRRDPRDKPAAPAAAAPREPAAEFRVDPHLPMPERMAPTGLVVAAPLAMPELLRAAERAYGYSRDILRAADKHELDAAG
ncbi:MAG: hypothetical protein ACK4NA_05690 [Alphaproteobacteria bacterium]